LEVEDRIARAYGLLRHVQKISYGELMEHLSWLRLGLSLEIKMQVTYHQLNQILLKSQPAHLDEKEGRELAPLERDAIRAQTIRQLLG
ncbi:MAG TPA: ATP--guanido phosphotransferase, partial [bacterium]|nr:ATP--guanido phosphotransferase [bacterium]